MFRLLALALCAAALDPVLEAAEEQQDKEQVVAYFAAARAQDQAEVKSEHEQDAIRTTKLYAQLKTASDKFWTEHKSRVSAEDNARAVGKSLYTSQKVLDEKTAQLTAAEKKQQALTAASDAEIAELREELEGNVTALERMTTKEHAASTTAANFKQELADEREAQDLRHKADVAALHKEEKQNTLLRKEMANETEKASEKVAAARLDAARARGALKEDTQLLADVRASTEKKIEAVRSEWAAQQKKVQGQMQQETTALKKLEADRDQLSKVAEAAVKKAESLEARKAAHSDVEVHEHHHKGHHKHHKHPKMSAEPKMAHVAEPEVEQHHTAPDGLIEPAPKWQEVAKAGETAKDAAADDLSEADAIMAEEDALAPEEAAVEAPAPAASASFRLKFLRA